MNFWITVCDRIVRVFSFAGLAVMVLFLAAGCTCLAQHKQIPPASEQKAADRDENLPSVKPATPPVSPESQKHPSTDEIEVQGKNQADSAAIELE
jgi:hypothetical protein